MDVEIEHPHHHHRSTGLRWLDLVLPLSALLISMVSIAIALHHGEVMQSLVHQNERLVQANSLPHLEINGSNATESGEPRISFTATNRGVGPADIRSVQVLVDGRPVPNSTALLAACCGGGKSITLTSTLLGRMVQPGQEVAYLRMPFSAENKQIGTRLNNAWLANRIVTEICYCSVFEECWTRSSKPFTRPVPVRSCPMPQTQYRT